MSAPGAPVKPGHVLRFLLGVLASGLLMAGAMTVLLTAVPAALPGWQVTAVSSGSMAPALQVGDAVALTRWPAGQPMLGPPSVVLIERPGEVPVLHRVIGRDDTSYQTKGDANTTADSERARPEQVLGVARLVVPAGGWLALWVQQGNLVALTGLLVAVLVLVWLARFGWWSRYDPWLAAAHRVGGGPPEPPSSPEGGGRGSDASGEEPRRGLRLAAGVLGCAVVGMLVGTGASTSAFSAQTAAATVISSATLQAPDALTARCTPQPQAGDDATAAPASPAPSLPTGAREGAPAVPSAASAQLEWTPSATERVTGYTVARDGVPVAQLSGRNTTSWTDPQPLQSSPSTYTLTATVGTWSSPPTSVEVSSSAC